MIGFLTNTVIGKLFDALREQLMKTQRGRWVLITLFLVMSALFAVVALTGHDTAQNIGFAIGGGFFLLLALIVLIGNIFIARQYRKNRQLVLETETHVKQLITEGKLLPIPSLPKNAPPGASEDDLLRVERYATQLREIPWGDRVEYPEDQARAVFESTMAEVQTISGDWSRLRDPIRVFTGLPEPLCYVGAAEVMFRLSYLHGMTFAPVGLRQGVRFAFRAQIHTLLQPDALIVQLKLLVACRVPYWQEQATKTLGMIQQVAPDHPRLPQAEMFYHNVRREYDQALIYADRALANATSPAETASLLSSKALLQMNLKRCSDAVATYQTALSLNPNDPWIWHNNSIALTSLGQYQEALQSSERALAIMDFQAARTQRDLILQKLSQAQSDIPQA